jgi:hypothetical protein
MADDIKQKMIAGVAFTISAPYKAGAVTLTDAEAKTLNQTRAENIGNNLREAVREEIAKGTAVEEIQKAVTEYDNKYNFSMGGGGGVARVVDPVERAARAIVKKSITDQLQAEGRKLKEVDPEALEALISENITRDDVLKLARKRVADEKRQADQAAAATGALNIGGLAARAPKPDKGAEGGQVSTAP